MMRNNQVLIICGQTATGKTSLGLRLAKKYNGEVVNFDSRQVYRGMDIGTGKDLPENSKFKNQNSKLNITERKYQIGYYLLADVPVWLLDIVAPDYRFSAADYLQCVQPVLQDIWSRERLPILVGGSGFYLQPLEKEVATLGVKPNWSQRKKWEKLPVEKLQERLKERDRKKFLAMNHSDRLNPRRLIRAIEVAQSDKKISYTPPLKGKNILKIGLRADIKFLQKKIKARIDARLKQGLLEEIAGLIKAGYNFSNSVLGETLAYYHWQDCFKDGHFLPPDAKQVEKIKSQWLKDELNYAKRQQVWFKKDAQIKWSRIDQSGWLENVVKQLEEWYTK